MIRDADKTCGKLIPWTMDHRQVCGTVCKNFEQPDQALRVVCTAVASHIQLLWDRCYSLALMQAAYLFLRSLMGGRAESLALGS